MNRIMELAELYADAKQEEKYANTYGDAGEFYRAREKLVEARAALQAEVDRLSQAAPWRQLINAAIIPEGHPKADKYESLYLAINNLLVLIGRNGSVNADSPSVEYVSDCLYDIDEGVFNETLFAPQAAVAVQSDQIDAARYRALVGNSRRRKRIWNHVLEESEKQYFSDIEGVLDAERAGH